MGKKSSKQINKISSSELSAPIRVEVLHRGVVQSIFEWHEAELFLQDDRKLSGEVVPFSGELLFWGD